MVEEPSEASVGFIYIDDDIERSVTREILGYLGILKNFWGYVKIFGGNFRERIGNFWTVRAFFGIFLSKPSWPQCLRLVSALTSTNEWYFYFMQKSSGAPQPFPFRATKSTPSPL